MEARNRRARASIPTANSGAGRDDTDSEANANDAPRPRCHLPWQEMIIQADGTVEPCCYWTAHGNANPPLGNINELSIEEIWNGEGYRRLRQNMAAGDLAAAGCANCFALKQGQALALEYDEDCEKPEYRGTPYADNIRILKDEVSRGANVLTAKPTILLGDDVAQMQSRLSALLSEFVARSALGA